MGRRLAPEEKQLWGRVIETVRPLHPVAIAKPVGPSHPARAEPHVAGTKPQPTVKLTHRAASEPNDGKNLADGGLDSHWDRRLHKGTIFPDISIDLHGQGLASAHARLDRALDQAIHQKLRVILLVTGKARAHDRASGSGRGAIAAVIRDWLAASRHSSSIAAIRRAHPRHGGDGALYIILKR